MMMTMFVHYNRMNFLNQKRYHHCKGSNNVSSNINVTTFLKPIYNRNYFLKKNTKKKNINCVLEAGIAKAPAIATDKIEAWDSPSPT